jgi:hypothetical protein
LPKRIKTEGIGYLVGNRGDFAAPWRRLGRPGA